ncbi:MAG: DUF3015 family protein [Bacteriovoracaceae bacterium]
MKLKLVLLTLITSAFTHAAFADSSVGCGLGSLVFKDNSLVSSTLRVTTNHMFLTQYLGVTSGTSGCTRHSIVMNEKAHIHFAEVNLDQLSKEMASGEGQYLNAFAFTLGCKNGLSKDLGAVAKAHYDQIFPNENVNANDMLKNLGATIRLNPTLSKNCSKAQII